MLCLRPKPVTPPPHPPPNPPCRRDGHPYCETHYHELFSPRCAYCNGVVLDRCITALGRTWHPRCFFCAHCGKSFEGGGFMEKDGKPYCEADYFAMFAPKCGKCDQAIMGDCVTAMGKQWHPECFVCTGCNEGFSGGSFFEVCPSLCLCFVLCCAVVWGCDVM